MSTREHQARPHAQAAKRKVAKRREKQSGAAGWIADRAAQWSLDGPDWSFVERQKYLWNPLMDYWFRMEIDGWEKLPDPPGLLIGIHSGARLCGTPGPWASSGGADSAISGPSTEPRTMR